MMRARTSSPRPAHGECVECRSVRESSFSRKDTPSNNGDVDKDNCTRKLNDALVAYGLGKDRGNAYEEAELPDTLSGVRDAVQTAFGRDIRAVAPTAERFDIFNGVHTGGEVYVNVKSDVGFVQIAGHELYHHIEETRPDLIESNSLRIDCAENENVEPFA